MRKILFMHSLNKFGMTDFNYIDYNTLHKNIRECDWNNNLGNKVWAQSIVSELTCNDIEYSFGYMGIAPEEVNNNFDLVIMPMANMFYEKFENFNKDRTEYIKKLKIPVYVIACGVQCADANDLPRLISKVEKSSREIIEAVYLTGGEFCLRGNITKQFFDMLGYKSAVVTGCPSLFQMGRDLRITNDKVSFSEFKASINGSFNIPVYKKDILKCDFIDQGVYTDILYNPDYPSKNPISLKKIAKDIMRNGYQFAYAKSNNKIKDFINTQDWLSYYIENNINFSFGSRIHGTVMPILSGVPSVIMPCDARTFEIADYFNIPIYHNKSNKKRRLYDIYCETDYTMFNDCFSEKFDFFEKFLQEHGIVSKINEDNIFMHREKTEFSEPNAINSDYIRKYKKKFNNYDFFFKLLDIFCNF